MSSRVFPRRNARVFALRKISLFSRGNGAAPVVTLAPILFANLRVTRVYYAANDRTRDSFVRGKGRSTAAEPGKIL